jgi:hypothetical protein
MMRLAATAPGVCRLTIIQGNHANAIALACYPKAALSAEREPRGFRLLG